MEKKDTKDRIAAEPGENVKEWIDEEGTDFDDNVETPKTMTEKTGTTDR